MNDFDAQPDLPEMSPPVPPAFPQVQAAPPRKWYQIWWEVWRYPGSDTFRMILAEPNTGSARSFIWIGVTAFFSGLLSGILSAVLASGGRTVASALICSVIAAPIGAIIGVALSSAIYHGIARLFGGTGRWEQLLFCFAAIYAPETLLGQLGYLVVPGLMAAGGVGRPVALSILLLCTIGVGLFVGLYSLVLFVFAVSGAENLSGGKAVVVVLIPTLLALAAGVCIAIVAAGAIASLMQFQ